MQLLHFQPLTHYSKQWVGWNYVAQRPQWTQLMWQKHPIRQIKTFSRCNKYLKLGGWETTSKPVFPTSFASERERAKSAQSAWVGSVRKKRSSANYRNVQKVVRSAPVSWTRWWLCHREEKICVVSCRQFVRAPAPLRDHVNPLFSPQIHI